MSNFTWGTQSVGGETFPPPLHPPFFVLVDYWQCGNFSPEFAHMRAVYDTPECHLLQCLPCLLCMRYP